VAFSLFGAGGPMVGRPGIYVKQHAFLPVGRTHCYLVPSARGNASTYRPNGSTVAPGGDLVRDAPRGGVTAAGGSGDAEHL